MVCHSKFKVTALKRYTAVLIIKVTLNKDHLEYWKVPVLICNMWLVIEMQIVLSSVRMGLAGVSQPPLSEGLQEGIWSKSILW